MIRLLLAILGLLALTDRADASGCHVPDRPTFGLNDEPFASSTPDLFPLTDQPPGYRHAPCPGESAGFPSKSQIPPVSVPTSSPPIVVIDAGTRSFDIPDLGRPLADQNPLERPPRLLPAP